MPLGASTACDGARMPTAISVSVRCWRQLTQIIDATASRNSSGVPIAEVGEDDLLEVHLVQLPARVVDVAVRAYEQRRLTFGVALADHLVHPRDGRRVGARSGEQAMACDDLVDRRGSERARVGQDHEVVAHPLEIGDDVRGEDHCHAVSLTTSITVFMNSRRASGSSDATGSSRISSSGRFASASVSATCACCPPESLPTLRSSGIPSRARRA